MCSYGIAIVGRHLRTWGLRSATRMYRHTARRGHCRAFTIRRSQSIGSFPTSCDLVWSAASRAKFWSGISSESVATCSGKTRTTTVPQTRNRLSTECGCCVSFAGWMSPLSRSAQSFRTSRWTNHVGFLVLSIFNFFSSISCTWN